MRYLALVLLLVGCEAPAFEFVDPETWECGAFEVEETTSVEGELCTRYTAPSGIRVTTGACGTGSTCLMSAPGETVRFYQDMGASVDGTVRGVLVDCSESCP